MIISSKLVTTSLVKRINNQWVELIANKPEFEVTLGSYNMRIERTDNEIFTVIIDKNGNLVSIQ